MVLIASSLRRSAQDAQTRADAFIDANMPPK
jgi:hypothetical protein